MSPGEDLSTEALERALPGRQLQCHATVISTASLALGWANKDAPDGAVVIADYQISARGHAGLPWRMAPGQGLAFSLIVRPSLPAAREGWLYTVVVGALADVCGDEAVIEWPDKVVRAGVLAAATGIDVRLGPGGVKFAVVNVLLPDAVPPRGEPLAAVLDAIDARRAQEESAVRADYERRCHTIGRQVRVRMLAGTGPKVEGLAVETLDDGALVLERDAGRKGAVRPQDVRQLEEA